MHMLISRRMKKNTWVSFLVLLLLLRLVTLLNAAAAELDAYQRQISGSSNKLGGGGGVNEIQVGVILDMRSWVGKVVHSCVSMAISDFYAVNTQYNTRVVLHTRDSKGEPLPALSAGEKLLSNLSKFVVIVWVFVVLILTSSYTATLTSLLTVQQIQLASNGNNIGYQGSSFVQGAIVSNLNFKDSQLVPYNSPEEYADALSRGSVVAIIDEIPYLKIFLAKVSASYAMVASESTTNGFGFVFRKGSPLVPEISRAIMQLRQDGKLMMIENAWFNSPSSFMSSTQQSSVTTSPSTLNLDSFRGLFLISGMSSTLALVILLIYSLHERWHAKVHSFRKLVWGLIVFYIKCLPTRNSNLIDPSNAR